MRRTYAVTWQEPEGPVCAGKLELRPSSLRLEGTAGSGAVIKELSYEELIGVRVGRAPNERLDGRPSLVLERRAGAPIRMASVAEPGIISELAELLASLHLGHHRAMSRVVVIVPLEEGARGRVQELLDQGPPFDPGEVGLERHHVFLTDREAVFFFEAEAEGALERLLGDENLWASAAAWRDFVAGPPRLTEEAYSWTRSRTSEQLFFEPTPGPGDSEGGEIYAP